MWRAALKVEILEKGWGEHGGSSDCHLCQFAKCAFDLVQWFLGWRCLMLFVASRIQKKYQPTERNKRTSDISQL